MKTDRYTKIILTVIAFALVANLLVSVLTPSNVHAGWGAKYEDIEMGGTFGNIFFDKKTGDIWTYEYDEHLKGDLKLWCHYKLVELGKDLQKVSGK